jgi:hypothetical protein
MEPVRLIIRALDEMVFRGTPSSGWSSPVARQAHNLKAARSNRAPATRFTELKNKS